MESEARVDTRLIASENRLTNALTAMSKSLNDSLNVLSASIAKLETKIESQGKELTARFEKDLTEKVPPMIEKTVQANNKTLFWYATYLIGGLGAVWGFGSWISYGLTGVRPVVFIRAETAPPHASQ